jgi:predicted MPP superfamily phosphohydrolase
VFLGGGSASFLNGTEALTSDLGGERMAISDSRKNRTLTWLHLSDIHFQQGDSYNRNVVLRALISAVQRFRTQGCCPNLIFFTGDIASSGKEKEYVSTSTFLDELLHAAGLDKKYLFIVPGNHDVDRNAAKGLERTLFGPSQTPSPSG